MVVSVNPITKAPTAFEPPDWLPNRIFAGQFQNVAEVEEEWVIQERTRLGANILSHYEEWSRYPERIAEAVAAERERCARIADQWSEACTWEHRRAGNEIAAMIREGAC